MSAPRTPHNRDERGHLPADRAVCKIHFQARKEGTQQGAQCTTVFSKDSVFVLCVHVSVPGRGWRVARGRQETEHPGSGGTRDIYFLLFYALLLLIYCLFGFYFPLTFCYLHLFMYMSDFVLFTFLSLRPCFFYSKEKTIPILYPLGNSGSPLASQLGSRDGKTAEEAQRPAVSRSLGRDQRAGL